MTFTQQACRDVAMQTYWEIKWAARDRQQFMGNFLHVSWTSQWCAEGGRWIGWCPWKSIRSPYEGWHQIKEVVRSWPGHPRVCTPLWPAIGLKKYLNFMMMEVLPYGNWNSQTLFLHIISCFHPTTQSQLTVFTGLILVPNLPIGLVGAGCNVSPQLYVALLTKRTKSAKSWLQPVRRSKHIIQSDTPTVSVTQTQCQLWQLLLVQISIFKLSSHLCLCPPLAGVQSTFPSSI